MESRSLLQKQRLEFKPELPSILENLKKGTFKPGSKQININDQFRTIFPHLTGNPATLNLCSENEQNLLPKNVGVVFSGGPAAGGHNVITGLHDALMKLNPQSKLIGFCNGPKGIIDNVYVELIKSSIEPYRNQGGFDMLGTGRTKIETSEQFQAAEKTARLHKLDGLVIVGGDDSNTNAALLAEYFKTQNCPTTVIGVPKTIDGDLKSEEVEISFGFDSASKTYSEGIGNLQQDSISAKKYYFFIKIMGRSASHLALECALKTHPNMTLIGEEIADKKLTLAELTAQISDMICKRADIGKDYGVILIPEGVIEFIPEFKQLIKELNSLLSDKSHAEKYLAAASDKEKLDFAKGLLSQSSKNCLAALPEDIQLQLLLDRDPHGNVQVSKIDTERLFIETVKRELKKRKNEGLYKGTFSPQPLFFGYEGRSCLPSNFDSQYCYALGYAAALLINSSATGYICTIANLSKPVKEWKIGGCNLLALMTLETRHGKEKPVIKKALVELKAKPFKEFQLKRDSWMMEDHYQSPGPIQFFGPKDLTDSVPEILKLERS